MSGQRREDFKTDDDESMEVFCVGSSQMEKAWRATSNPGEPWLTSLDLQRAVVIDERRNGLAHLSLHL